MANHFPNTGCYKFHSCLAQAHFERSEGEVRQAIVKVVTEDLPGSFSMAKTSYEDSANLEVEYVTPGGWLDVVSIQLEEQGDTCHLYIFSKSTNLCPITPPWKWFRGCCSCWKLFQDSGQNEAHVQELLDALEKELNQSSFLEIQHS